MLSQEEIEEAVLDKRKHIRITPLCNNNCRFCLASDMRKDSHYSIESIRNDLESGIKEGFTRLILSGGEPSIHPELIDIIRIGKSMGYKKVQMISNGRMFCNKDFLDKCVKAGLDEITFSIHGHTKELHDYLTKSPGSFNQTVKGIRNALESGIIVSSDIVVNKKNYRHFPEIIRFLYKTCVREIDVLHIVPFGSAYKNKEIMFYDLDDGIKYIREGLRFAKEHDIVIWTNRLPPEYLEGFENLMQDSSKLIDEMYGRKADFEDALKNNNKPYCFGDRCKFCHMKKMCESLFNANDLIKSGKSDKTNEKDEINVKINADEKNENMIVLDSKTIDSISKIMEENPNDEFLIDFPIPGNSLLKYKQTVVKLSESIPLVMDLAKRLQKKVLFRNVPQCICGEGNELKDEFCINDDYLNEDGEIDVVRFAEQYSKQNKIKSLRCNNCNFNDRCDGIFQKYIQIYGFQEIKPVDKSHIEFNIGKICNNKCLFCMDDDYTDRFFIPLNQLKQELSKLRESGYKSIGFLGGEPTIYPDFIEVIKFARKLGFDKINIVSNGRKFSDKKFLKDLIDAGATQISVSIHSHLPETEDYLTQVKGGFEQKLKGLLNLIEFKRSGALKDVIPINIVINKLNIDSLFEMIGFFFKIGITEFRLNFIRPEGYAEDNFNELVPRYSKLGSKINKLADFDAINKINLTFGDIPFCVADNFENLKHLFSEYHDYFDNVRSLVSKDESMVNFSWDNERKNLLKTKFDFCGKCRYDNTCEGPWKRYVDKFGADEFKEVR